MFARSFQVSYRKLTLGIALLVVWILWFTGSWWLRIPPIHGIGDYHPPEQTFLYAADGQVITSFAKERRTVVPYQQIPEHVINAFLAAEDVHFFSHQGIDYLGILRAAIKNLRPHAHLQGASTITQQLVKTLILGPERSYWRKLREAILAHRFEQTLSKQDILALYLNQIYFGSGAWGLQEAAWTYFQKGVAELSVADGAILAGIPKYPNKYTPFADAKACASRKRFVVQQMLQHQLLDEPSATLALQTPLPPPRPRFPLQEVAGDYIEEVRRTVLPLLGEQALYEGGYRIDTAMQPHMQHSAVVALRQTIADIASRRGFEAPIFHLEQEQLAPTLAFWRKKSIKEHLPQGAWLWDVRHCLPLEQHFRDCHITLASLQAYTSVQVPVVAIDRKNQTATLDGGGSQVTLSRQAIPTWGSHAKKTMQELLHVGDVVEIQLQPFQKDISLGQRLQAKAQPTARLVPTTPLQGALVAIDPATRGVVAMIGAQPGSVRIQGGFNRATMAYRQLGSAIKPFVYAVGLELGAITPISVCADAPIHIQDPWTGTVWRPKNFEGRFDGNLTYRQALSRSKNTCTIRLLQKIGPEKVIPRLQQMELGQHIPNNLTLALGTADVTPLAVTNAYATFVAQGWYQPATLITRLYHPHHGAPALPAQAEPIQVFSPEVAAVTVHLLTGVVEEGTASRANVLQRPVAGKTGTSQEHRNVWFSGFSPELVATVWLGMDDNSPMGRFTGSSGALPGWIRFMGMALAQEPIQTFQVPPTVVRYFIDKEQGKVISPPLPSNQTALAQWSDRQAMRQNNTPNTTFEEYFVPGIPLPEEVLTPGDIYQQDELEE